MLASLHQFRRRIGAFIGGFEAGFAHRRLKGFQPTRAQGGWWLGGYGGGGGAGAWRDGMMLTPGLEVPYYIGDADGPGTWFGAESYGTALIAAAPASSNSGGQASACIGDGAFSGGDGGQGGQWRTKFEWPKGGGGGGAALAAGPGNAGEEGGLGGAGDYPAGQGGDGGSGWEPWPAKRPGFWYGGAPPTPGSPYGGGPGMLGPGVPGHAGTIVIFYRSTLGMAVRINGTIRYSGEQGHSYLSQFTAAGGSGGYVFDIEGTLPPGLSSTPRPVRSPVPRPRSAVIPASVSA